MAIVINPDGTVSTIEVDHDAYGNIRPKMPQDIAEKPSEKPYMSSSQKKDVIYPKMQKKKHRKLGILVIHLGIRNRSSCLSALWLDGCLSSILLYCF